MGTLKKMEDSAVEMRKISINWKQIDKGKQANNYYTPEKYIIYPGVVYHYIAAPVQKVFPSVDNIMNFVLPGIYFHPDYFLAVHYNKTKKEYEASIIKPRNLDLKSVTFSIKFISKPWLSDNQYFGSEYTTNPNYVSVWKVYNLSSRESEVPDISWLEEYVGILNPDDLRSLCLNSRTDNERTRVCGKADYYDYHTRLEEDIDDQDNSVYASYYMDNEKTDNIVNHIKGEIGASKGKGKGKGFKFFPSKGKGKASDYEEMREPPIHPGIRHLTENDCYIIDLEGKLYSWSAPDKLTTISVFRSNDKRADLLTLKKVIEEMQTQKEAFELSIKRESKEDEDRRKPQDSRKPSSPESITRPRTESDNSSVSEKARTKK